MGSTTKRSILAVVAAACLPCLVGGCFSAQIAERSYYVLHGVSASITDDRPIAGLLRVRNMDAASIYEKFQIVVRRNPYELLYSESNVWAVKPNQMVSDVIARALGEVGSFTAVQRELGELRPDYILSGDLNSIEIYDSGDLWYAHLSITLRLTRYDSGATLLSFDFDERKDVPTRTFAQGARALSELLSTAVDELIVKLGKLDLPRAARPEAPAEPEAPKPAEATSPGTIFVPETPPPGGR